MATSTPTRFSGFLPERVAIDAYGNGGFRFGGMSHRGSLLALPDGMHVWLPGSVAAPSDLGVPLQSVLTKLVEPQFLLVGTGRKQVFPTSETRRVFLAQRIGLEVMDTGAACRTYNVLLAEGRPVMLAAVAVE